MPDSHSEIEFKLDASGVDQLAFVQWCLNRGPDRYEHVNGPDVYYTQGDNTVRHRQNIGSAGELTVKRRKTKTDVIDRVEIDLTFGSAVTVDDVTKFLLASGWEPLFTLIKEAHIFWYKTPIPVTVVIYDVSCLDKHGKPSDGRRFIEVEIEKGSKETALESRAELTRWLKEIRRWFSVNGPVTLSLYEIYSGKRYSVMETKKRRARNA